MEKLLITTDTDGTIFAIRMKDGTIAWQCATHHDLRGVALAQSSDTVLAATGSGCLLALHIADGRLIWDTQIAPGTRFAPIVIIKMLTHGSLGAVGITDRPSIVVVFQVDDGKVLWQHHPERVANMALLAMNQQHTYVTELHVERPPHFTMRAFATVQGDVLWSHDALIIPPAPFSPVVPSSPFNTLIERDGIAYGCGRTDLFAFQAESGTPMWHHDLSHYLSPTSSNVRDLLVEQDRLFLNTEDVLGSFSLVDGHEFWSIPRSERDLENAERLTMIGVHADILYVGSSTFNYERCKPKPEGFLIDMRDQATGHLIGSWPSSPCFLNDVTPRHIAMSQGIWYIPAQDHLHAVDAVSHQTLWTCNVKAGYCTPLLTA